MKVLIVGAGIAGLTLARALSEIAAEVRLVDPDPRPAGVGVGLSANALRPLGDLGLGPALLDVAAPSLDLHMCEADGSTILHTRREIPVEAAEFWQFLRQPI